MKSLGVPVSDLLDAASDVAGGGGGGGAGGGTASSSRLVDDDRCVCVCVCVFEAIVLASCWMDAVKVTSVAGRP